MKSKLIPCKSCGHEIAKNAKSCPHCGAKNRKPIFKKWWFWLIVLFFLGAIGSGGDDTTSEPVTLPAPSAQPISTEPVTSSAVTIDLVAGEAGSYGELFTINKGTEFEETYYIYHIPAGTYTVTNTGEYMNQFNVYSDEITVNDAGWEEPAAVVYVKSLDVGVSDTFTITDGQFIEIHEPAKFTLEMITTTLNETVTEVSSADETKGPALTLGQKNALSSAKSYLSFSAFSYEGLIAQLEFEKYSHEDAVFAADNCNADWDEQALKSAKNYLSFSAFSYTGLIRQLEFEKFTNEQATYAADHCGADWNEQAAKSAKNYLSFSSFSKDGLIGQLEFEGFTKEQAIYGVTANGYE